MEIGDKVKAKRRFTCPLDNGIEWLPEEGIVYTIKEIRPSPDDKDFIGVTLEEGIVGYNDDGMETLLNINMFIKLSSTSTDISELFERELENQRNNNGKEITSNSITLTTT